MNKKIGFIGCGKMATAIIKGILSANYVSNKNIKATVTTEQNAIKKSSELGIEVGTDNKKLVDESNVIFLATTPNKANDVLEEIKSCITTDKLVVSVCAGIKTNTIESILDKNISVIRVMPNTPALILEGMSGVAGGKYSTPENIKFVMELLSNIGKSVEVDESQIDIVTAISGSGPAFYYKIINEIARAGEKLGLDYEKSLALSIQTAIGSAKMILNSDKSVEELIESVATKGGCTRVGVDFMDEADTKDILYNLISKTAKKAGELG